MPNQLTPEQEINIIAWRSLPDDKKEEWMLKVSAFVDQLAKTNSSQRYQIEVLLEPINQLEQEVTALNAVAPAPRSSKVERLTQEIKFWINK